MSVLVPEPVPALQGELPPSWGWSPLHCALPHPQVQEWFLGWGPSLLCMVQPVAPSPPPGIHSANVECLLGARPCARCWECSCEQGWGPVFGALKKDLIQVSGCLY